MSATYVKSLKLHTRQKGNNNNDIVFFNFFTFLHLVFFVEQIINKIRSQKKWVDFVQWNIVWLNKMSEGRMDL